MLCLMFQSEISNKKILQLFHTGGSKTQRKGEIPVSCVWTIRASSRWCLIYGSQGDLTCRANALIHFFELRHTASHDGWFLCLSDGAWAQPWSDLRRVTQRILRGQELSTEPFSSTTVSKPVHLFGLWDSLLWMRLVTPKWEPFKSSNWENIIRLSNVVSWVQ